MGTERNQTPNEERHEVDHFPIIGIIGPIAAGKETIAKILKDNYGIAQFTISENLQRLALTRGMKPPFSRDLLWGISLEIIDELGPGGNIIFTKS